MEIIVQRFRALASDVRIRIIRVLVVLGETSVNKLADATGIRPCTISFHLRVLVASGLVWRRRSGRTVYYRVADEPSSRLTQQILLLLERAFRGVRVRDPKLVAQCDQADSPKHSDAVLFAYFTAFTHPRRLQIIRELHTQETATPDSLVRRLSMSPQACSRHALKLSRRGFVSILKTAEGITYTLVRGGNTVQRRLMDALLAEMLEPQ